MAAPGRAGGSELRPFLTRLRDPAQSQPRLAVDKQTLRFGKVQESKRAELRITNAGAGTLRGRVGQVDAPFKIVSGGGTFQLAAGATRLVTLRFTARRPVTSRKSLRIFADSGQPKRLTVSLIARGTR